VAHYNSDEYPPTQEHVSSAHVLVVTCVNRWALWWYLCVQRLQARSGGRESHRASSCGNQLPMSSEVEWGLFKVLCAMKNWDSLVGIVNVLHRKQIEVWFLAGSGDSSHLHMRQTVSGAPPSPSSSSSFPPLVHKADNSSPSGADGNTWSCNYSSVGPYGLVSMLGQSLGFVVRDVHCLQAHRSWQYQQTQPRRNSYLQHVRHNSGQTVTPHQSGLIDNLDCWSKI
jgi:hypothetical protein